MSRENVELIKAVFDGWYEDGAEGMIKLFHEDIDYLPIEEDGVIHGYGAMRRYFTRWMEPWETFQVEPTEFVDSGDHVVNEVAMRGRGRGSGVESAMRYWQAWTIRGGKVVRWEEFFDKNAALEAVGLREEPGWRENVEVVRRIFDAGARGDAAAALALYDPEVELDSRTAAFDGGVYHGHSGVNEFFSVTRDPWQSQSYEPLEFIPAGEDLVITTMRITSVGRDDIEIVSGGALLFMLRNGRVIRVKTFQTKADALEAVGLPE